MSDAMLSETTLIVIIVLMVLGGIFIGYIIGRDE